MPSRPPLVLASSSPRRAALLEQAGVSFVVAPAACDEAVRAGEAASAYAQRVAADKRAAALAAFGDDLDPNQLLLTADTVVWVGLQDPTPLGKPTSAVACARMLDALTGPAGHRVTTAWTLGPVGGDTVVRTTTTHVWMRSLGDHERSSYLQTDAWRDKAGGYGIQAEAASWVLRLEGSYTNVVGLPLAEVVSTLQGAS